MKRYRVDFYDMDEQKIPHNWERKYLDVENEEELEGVIRSIMENGGFNDCFVGGTVHIPESEVA